MANEFTLQIQDIGERLLDQFQTQVETSIIQHWQESVNDKRYKKELMDGMMNSSVISRENGPGVRVSVFRGGPIAEQYEEGKKPFDLKPGLLQGPNSKQGKHGRYNTVPFRHGAPREAETGHFQVMPDDIYRLVSKKYIPGGDESPSFDQSESFDVDLRGGNKGGIFKPLEKGGFKSQVTEVMMGANGRKQYNVKERGHRLNLTGGAQYYAKSESIIKPRSGVNVGKDFFEKLYKSGKLKNTGGEFPVYKWKTSKYQGMIREGQQYEHAFQTHYMTFRRVSENSDPNSWWHPGFPKRPVIAGLIQYAQETMPLLWEQFTEAINARL